MSKIWIRLGLVRPMVVAAFFAAIAGCQNGGGCPGGRCGVAAPTTYAPSSVTAAPYLPATTSSPSYSGTTYPTEGSGASTPSAAPYSPPAYNAPSARPAPAPSGAYEGSGSR